MRFFTSFWLIFITIFFTQIGWGQVFNVAGGGALPTGWTATNNVTTNAIDQSSYYLLDAGNPSDVLTTSSYNLCSYTSATFRVNIQSYGSGAHNSLSVEVSSDGGATFATPVITAITTTGYVTQTVNIASVTSTMVIRLKVNATTGRGIRLQTIQLTGNGTASCSSNTITTGALSASNYGVNCTTGANGTVAYTSVGTFAGANTYTVELSNVAGSFATPTTIGTLTSSANSGSISFTIPSATVSGTGYKVRILSDNPAVTGTESAAFQITLTGSCGPCYTGHAPNFTASGTFAGDVDAGGSPTTTIRLATTSVGGSVTTTATGVTAGDVTVKFRAKGWSATETSVTVNIGGQSTTITTLPTAFGWVSVNFTGVSANPSLTFSTVANKRVHIGNVEIYCTPVNGPEILVEGNATEIVSGDVTPSATDHTDFGSVDIAGGTVVRTFTIRNTGNQNLTVTNITSSNSADFAVGGTTAVVIPASGSHTFTVTFDPTTTGTKTSTITIANDDANEGTYTFAVQGNAIATPTIVLNSSNPAVAVGTVQQGSTNNIVYAFDLTVTNFNTVLNSVAITTAGTYVAADLTNIKLWYSADATFSAGTDVLLGTKTTGLGAGTQTYSGLTQAIAQSTTGYLFVTLDLPCSATASNTISVNAITTANLTFSAGNKSGTAYAGGAKTISASTPNNVTSPATSNCVGNGTTVSWTLPAGCYDEIMVVASNGTYSAATPTGNGSAYTANTTFGSGTSFDGGSTVYKGTGATVNVTGLTVGITYTFKIFTRKGTQWSSGVTVSCTPSIVYCNSGATSSTDSEIENVVLTGESTSISNNTSNMCTTGVSDFTSMSADLQQGGTYSVTVEFGDCDGGNLLSGAGGVWIDWNNDGDFNDANEAIGTILIAGGSTNFITSFTINVSISQPIGNYRMRVVQKESGTLANLDPCSTFNWGAAEDYTVKIINACVPTHSVTSVAPTSGPRGTEITITGTGFTASSTVQINGTSAIVTFVNSTTLIAEVAAGTTSGTIVVFESGCRVFSSTFTIIQTDSGCLSSGAFTDVFISAVYDSESASANYVELFNPTSSAIDLSASNYRILIDNRGASDVGVTVDVTIILPAGSIIPAGGFYLVNFGTSSVTTYGCPSSPYDYDGGGGGLNNYDYVILSKNGSYVDRVELPNESGISYKRKQTAVAPNTTYNSNDWNINTTASCGDLSSFSLPSFAPTVSSIIDNGSCSSLDFSVTAAAGNSGALTYKWYYNDGISTGWTEVTSSVPSGLTISGEATNHLIVSAGSNPISTINGFQFYCKVTESGSCANVSNAEQFEGSEDRYYKSTQSGNWTTTSTWLMAPAVSGPWVAACSYPTATNSDYISIENGHTVTLNIDLSADQIIVQATGILQLNEKLTVPNGNAATEDVQVIGTLIDNGNTTNGLEFTGGGTWLLDAQGTIIKTWSSSVAQYKNNYQGGIATIPATAKWYYRYVGNDNVATTTEGMYYPNLYFESNSGFHSWDAADEVLNGSTATATVKGNLSVGRTNTGTVELFNNNTFTTPISVLGNVYVGTGSLLRNTSQGTGIGTGFDIKGDSVLVNGAYSVNASGTGKTIFSGAAMQHIVSTAAGTFNAAHVELNNANGARLNGIDMNISSTLTFVNGILHTIIAQADKVNITNNATTAIVGGQAQSAFNRYVDGKLQWLTAAGSTYVFPVGSNKVTYGAQGFNFTVDNGNGAVLAYLEANASAPILDYAYCDLETHPGAGTVNVGNGNPGYDGIADQVNFNLHSPLQWHITNPSGAVTQYDITVLATGNQNINPVVSANGVSIRYLMKNGQPGNPNVATTTATGFSDLGFDMCPNQYTLLNLTSFSLFTLDGATQSGTVLPIEMVSFTGTAVQPNSAQLNWVTASELNNDYFTLLYSTDGLTFEPLAEVDGAGTSKAIHNYTHRHNHLPKGVHYYRLLSTDFDGKVYDRGAVAVEIDLNQIYYNPITASIELPSANNVKIYSTEGKLVAEGNGVNSIPFHHRGLFLIYFVDSGTTEQIVIR